MRAVPQFAVVAFAVLVILLGSVALLVGFGGLVEKRIESQTVHLELWDNPAGETLNSLFDDGWRVTEFYGDGCSYLRVTLQRTVWRLKK